MVLTFAAVAHATPRSCGLKRLLASLSRWMHFHAQTETSSLCAERASLSQLGRAMPTTRASWGKGRRFGWPTL